MGHPIYHLEVTITSGRVEALLNGLPVLSLSDVRGLPAMFAPPINPYLTGAKNELELVLLPAVRPDGSATTFDVAELSVSVKEFEKGGIVAPDTGRTLLALGISDELRKRVKDEKLHLPISIRGAFATPAVDLSADLRDAPVIDDVEALRDYGVRLRDLVAARDVGGLIAEFEGKIAAFATAYEEPPTLFVDSLREVFGEFVAAGPVVDFPRAAIVAQPYCGGRIWELTLGGETPLLRTPEVGEAKDSHQIRVYVGARAGALRVMR